MTRVSKLLAATAIVAAGFAGQANATPYYSSFQTSTARITPNGSTDLLSATSLSFNAGVSALSIFGFQTGASSFGPNYTSLGNVNGGETITLSTASISTAGTDTGFHFSWVDEVDSVTFTFTATSELVSNNTIGNSSGLNFSWIGNVTSTNPSLFASQTADFTLGFTQTGNGQHPYTGSISLSGTFDTPNTLTTVPEPMTMSILGLGLAGLAAARRRRA